MSSPADRRALAYAAVIGQTLISAFTYLAARQAMGEIPPVPLLVLRFGLAAGVYIAILSVGPGPRLPPRSFWPKLLVLGFLVGPINQGFFFYGLSSSSPAHAALLYALTPTGVYLLSLWRGRERLQSTAVAGLVAALGGVFVLLLGRGLREALGPLLGDLLILIAVAAWVVYTDQGKSLIPKHGALRLTAWTMICGAAWVVPLGPFVLKAQMLQVSSVTWACVAYLAVVTSVISYLLWYYALSKLDASKVAVFANLQPVFTALAALWLLHEPLHWELIVGGALVLVGVRLTATARTMHPLPASAAPLDAA